MSLNMDKICRTCLIEGVNISLQLNPTIVEMLMSFTKIQIQEDDGLPGNICVPCISEINRAYSFKQKSERTESTLKLYVDQISAKNDEDTTANQETIFPDLSEITDLILKSDDEPEPFDDNEPNDDATLEILEENEDIADDPPPVDDKPESIVVHCEICDLQFDSKDVFRTHAMESHKVSYCEPCCKVFDIGKSYNDHFRTVHGAYTKPNYKCEFCKADFVHKTNYEKHLSKYHTGEEVPVPLTHCLKTSEVHESNKLNDLANYEVIIDVEAFPYKCEKCDGRFAKEKSLRLHRNSNKCTDPSFPCDSCDKVFAMKKSLLEHQEVHLEKGFPCPMCNLSFTLQEQLETHKKEHSGNKKHQCTECGKGFNMKSTLNDHFRVHSRQKPFLCSICGRGFSQNTNLKQHLMRHNNTKRFQCNMCLKAFVSKGELKSHIRSHDGSHPFICDICETGFTTSSSLLKHKKIHSGEKGYACEFCPMRFTALGTLKNHRRTHTGETPFECVYCERKFAQKSDMVSHTKMHTGEKKSGALKLHLKKKHDSTTIASVDSAVKVIQKDD